MLYCRPIRKGTAVGYDLAIVICYTSALQDVYVS